MTSATLGLFPLGLRASLNITLKCSQRCSPSGGGAWPFTVQVRPWHAVYFHARMFLLSRTAV